jgi:hypothetical protein
MHYARQCSGGSIRRRPRVSMLTSTNFYGNWMAKVPKYFDFEPVVLNELTDLPDIWRAKEAESFAMKYWKIIADNLRKAGFGLGPTYVLLLDHAQLPST